jgi:hypothetical protein
MIRGICEDINSFFFILLFFYKKEKTLNLENQGCSEYAKNDKTTEVFLMHFKSNKKIHTMLPILEY